MHTISKTIETLGVGNQAWAISTGQTWFGRGTVHIPSFSPVDGKEIGTVAAASTEDYETMICKAMAAFKKWRKVPAPKRGEIIRQIGAKFSEHKAELGALVSYEMGKSLQEGAGEVQEIIDICEFAAGLSRQLYGQTMHSERPAHRMFEQWHPLGPVGIISAFNFPVAVWSWNAMIAAVCGNVSIWKPSEKTPLVAVACFHIMQEVLKKNQVPEGVFNLIFGHGPSVGDWLVSDKRIPLISATGSTRMGRLVGQKVASRLGRSLLELGGNNALILTEKADLEMAIPTVVFGAVGTAGQRCTTTRRLLVHDSIYERVKSSLTSAYSRLRVGSPLDELNHMGPLIDRDAVEKMQAALRTVMDEGGKILFGGDILSGAGYESGCYVRPALVEARPEMCIVQEETFAPILYIIKYHGDIDAAIELQNSVTQGLSSALFTNDLLEAEVFLSAWGSDCGIANVNLGTSGAEIGGAFGGEKDSGGGREAGSDAWKAYMRRQTNTINFGRTLPLAQGIKFELS